MTNEKISSVANRSLKLCKKKAIKICDYVEFIRLNPSRIIGRTENLFKMQKMKADLDVEICPCSIYGKMIQIPIFLE